MKQCSNCQLYHSNSQILRSTHQPTSYLEMAGKLRDEGSRRANKQQKMSQWYNPSSAVLKYHSQERTPARGVRNYSTRVDSNVRTVKKYQTGARTKASEKIDKKIELVIAKHKLSNSKHNKCISAFQTSPSKQELVNQTSVERKRMPTDFESDTCQRQSLYLEQPLKKPKETPFKKPFSSVEYVKNPIVYDTLQDNRCCGFNMREAGEMTVTGQMRTQLLMRMKLERQS